jgi:NADH-quinone oxidoreductase subunit G
LAQADPGKIGAIAGDLATVEEMYALKALMTSLGSTSLDCRQDGTALDPSLGRASYIFNPTIEGIEKADALLIIGSNPRFEASMLNARIRKRWRTGGLQVAMIGEAGDTRYDYDLLGSGPDTLKELAGGTDKFFQTLKKASHPIILVGQGALARGDGAAVLGLAAKLTQAVGAAKQDWNGSAYCTRRLRVLADLISALCRARAVAILQAFWRKATCFSCSAPTSWT